MLACPITNQVKGYSFEVVLPSGLPVTGVVLADQVKSLDWQARRIRPAGQAPEDVIDEVFGKLQTLLS